MHIRTLHRKAAARQAFMRWLAIENPALASRINPGMAMNGLADLLPDYLTPPKDTRTEYVTAAPGTTAKVTTTAAPAAVQAQESWWQSAVSNITKALPQLATSYAQIRLVNSNLQRAQQGLPPIDPASIAPTVKVQGSLDPTLVRNLAIGAALIGGAILLPKLVR